MFEKLKEYGLYVVLGLIALGALAYAYVQTSNSQKGAELHQASLDAMVANMSKSDKLKKSSTVADNLLEINGGKTIGQYKIDDRQVSYVIGETYDDIFNNKRTIDIASEFDDVEEGKLRTILIAQPATQVNGEDIDVIGLNSDKSITIGENTITKENLSGVDNELKGYNISAIGYGLFENEQSAKDFRDTYFSSYEIYEVGNTGKFIILNEYNTTRGGETLGTKINSSTTGTTTEVGGGDVCNEYLCLDANGVTMKAKPDTACGQEYIFQGQKYYVICDNPTLLNQIMGYGYDPIILEYLEPGQTATHENFGVLFGDCTYEDERGIQNNACGTGYTPNHIITTKMTSLRGVFLGLTHFNEDISNWDVSNITNMSATFYESAFTGNLSSWDVSNVTNMGSMFKNTSFNSNSIINWNVSNVTNMENMFCGSAFNQPIGNWNVSNVTNMENMFDGSQFNQDIGNWNVSNVTNMGMMFNRNSNFNNGGSDSIKNWDTGNVTNMNAMFRGTAFDQDISSWNVSNVNAWTSRSTKSDFSDQTPSTWTEDEKPNFD